MSSHILNPVFGIYPDKIPCRLIGWTHGHLNAWAYPGECSTDTWVVKSVCETVSIRVAASVAKRKIDCDGLPGFYYD